MVNQPLWTSMNHDSSITRTEQLSAVSCWQLQFTVRLSFLTLGWRRLNHHKTWARKLGKIGWFHLGTMRISPWENGDFISSDHNQLPFVGRISRFCLPLGTGDINHGYFSREKRMISSFFQGLSLLQAFWEFERIFTIFSVHHVGIRLWVY